MKTATFANLCQFLLLVAGVAAAGKHAPAKPGLTYLYTVNITGSNITDLGPGPFGHRLISAILSGSFEGPKLKGKYLRGFMSSPGIIRTGQWK